MSVDVAPFVISVALTSIALVVLVTTVVLRRTERQVRALTQRVEDWHGASEPAPLGTAGRRGAWQDLASALDQLAASYTQRAATLDAERPWRLQLVDALTQPALLFDADGRLRAANASAGQLMGLPPGARGLTVLGSTASSGIAEAVERVRTDGDALTVETTREGRDLQVSVSSIGDETLVVVTDRTIQRRLEDLRRDFVVNASHELKTPVTAIQTLGEALAVTLRDDPTRAAGLVKRLNDESERLARLVGELLDLRRLEVGGPLERVPVDVAELIRLIVAEQLPRAEARTVSIEVDVPERAHVAGVHADLEAIIKNLVSNAVKYNRDGGTVRVTLRTVDGAQVIDVSDSGIGIRQQDLPRVFERFYRVDTARSRATGGTGLGLSIVRHAVERHGGTVQVVSSLGEGSTFTVALPIEARG
jgi:two-component system, OmpR family, sensor histidine kinase SenX3